MQTKTQRVAPGSPSGAGHVSRYGAGVWVALVVLGSARASYAAGLGIPLDGFLTTFTTWVIGLGFLIGIVGLAGWIGSHMDNSYSPLLAGSVGFFTKAGLLGGGTA